MYKLTDIWKDALSRVASGEFVDLSTIKVPDQIRDILEKINSTKIDLDKDNVYLILKAVNPEVFIGYDKNISNTDIVYLLQQESAKHTISDIERKITQAILKNQNNPLFKWDSLLSDIQDTLSQINSKSRKYTMWDDDIDLSASQGVCSFGYDILDCLDGGGISAGSYTVFYGAWGVGKCFGIGTKVLMFDGTFKQVENIEIGDIVMGWDSTPRKVLSLHRGVDKLYKHESFGESFTCNSKHELVFRHRGNIIDIPVEEWLLQPRVEKQRMRHLKVSVDFQEKPLDIDPYYFGLWLGDGHSASLNYLEIGNKDIEILDYFERYTNELGASVKIRKSKNKKGSQCYIISFGGETWNTYHPKNKLAHIYQKYSLNYGKYIPDIFLHNSRENRLKLLAGLIDSDGYYNGRGQYEITLVNRVLCEQILYLTRSLGFRASTIKTKIINGKEYYKLGFSGNAQDIPILVERKKPTRGFAGRYKNDVEAYPYTIEECGVGEYFGFQIEGDGRFLLHDFSVVHNSTVGTQQIAYRALKQGLKPLVIFLEGNYKKFMAGIKLRLAGFPIDNVEVNWTKYKDQVNEKLKDTDLSFPIVNHGASNRYELDNLLREYKPDVVIYDQITIGSKTREWQDIAKMSETLKKLALETGIPVVAMTQSDESNYGNGADENDNERNKKNCSGGVKYSKAIVEDATTLVHIHHTYPHNTTRRLLSVKKTKDDTLARKGQVTIEVEWTANGLDDIAIIEKDGLANRRINKAEFLILNKRISPLIEKPIEIVTKKDGEECDTTIVEEKKVEVIRDNKRMPDNLEGGYDEMRYETTGARLSIIGEVLGIPSLLDLGVTWDKYHKNTFDSKFLDVETIDNATHEPYLYYYHNGNKNKNFDVIKDTATEEETLELGI